MDSVEAIRIGEECAEARLGAEINRPAPVFGARKIGRIGMVEDPPAEGDKAPVFLRRDRWHVHDGPNAASTVLLLQ